MKNWHRFLVVAGALILSVLVIFTYGTNSETIKAPSVPEDAGIYTLASGSYNVASYIEAVKDKAGGRIKTGHVYRDGRSWDHIVLIDPKIIGERVYIPAHEYDGEEGHFFFLDTLQKVEGTVYRVKKGAETYIDPSEIGVGLTSIDITWDYQNNEDVILINPSINKNGMQRVYVPKWNLRDKQIPDGVQPFIYRHNLQLLQLQ